MQSRVKKQIRIIKDGLINLISEKDLEERLERSIRLNRPLRIKYGVDPSSPDLHLGHTVPLRKLKQFQDLGHCVVFIIGDFTARIGDPTQRSETRRMLSREEVNRNAVTYQHQVFKILDVKKTEVRYNTEWFGKMGPDDFLHLTSQYTVARLLERDDFQKRYKANEPIALIELMYPLLQGYDSLKVSSDIELGGSDQIFNLLVGRELQKSEGRAPQIVMTLPLLEGTDGVQKMSKSYHNTIDIEAAPPDMYGKVMSIPDALLGVYYRYVSGLAPDEFQGTLEGIQTGKIHPREAKARLAEHIVALYHGSKAASDAGNQFDQVFKRRELPDEIETVDLPGKNYDLVSLLKEAGLAASKSEARRLVEQGGVKVERQKVLAPGFQVSLKGPVLIQCGKRKFLRVRSRD